MVPRKRNSFLEFKGFILLQRHKYHFKSTVSSRPVRTLKMIWLVSSYFHSLIDESSPKACK